MKIEKVTVEITKYVVGHRQFETEEQAKEYLGYKLYEELLEDNEDEINLYPFGNYLYFKLNSNEEKEILEKGIKYANADIEFDDNNAEFPITYVEIPSDKGSKLVSIDELIKILNNTINDIKNI